MQRIVLLKKKPTIKIIFSINLKFQNNQIRFMQHLYLSFRYILGGLSNLWHVAQICLSIAMGMIRSHATVRRWGASARVNTL